MSKPEPQLPPPVGGTVDAQQGVVQCEAVRALAAATLLEKAKPITVKYWVMSPGGQMPLLHEAKIDPAAVSTVGELKAWLPEHDGVQIDVPTFTDDVNETTDLLAGCPDSKALRECAALQDHLAKRKPIFVKKPPLDRAAMDARLKGEREETDLRAERARKKAAETALQEVEPLRTTDPASPKRVAAVLAHLLATRPLYAALHATAKDYSEALESLQAIAFLHAESESLVRFVESQPPEQKLAKFNELLGALQRSLHRQVEPEVTAYDAKAASRAFSEPYELLEKKADRNQLDPIIGECLNHGKGVPFTRQSLQGYNAAMALGDMIERELKRYPMGMIVKGFEVVRDSPDPKAIVCEQFKKKFRDDEQLDVRKEPAELIHSVDFVLSDVLNKLSGEGRPPFDKDRKCKQGDIEKTLKAHRKEIVDAFVDMGALGEAQVNYYLDNHLDKFGDEFWKKAVGH
jgi:hypothetical protein